MEIGARVSTKDITAIRKRLKEAKLTPEEVMAARNGKLTTAAARRQSAKAALDFQERLYNFVQDVIYIRDASDLRTDAIRSAAEFEGLFGADHRSPDEYKRKSRERYLSNAYFALVHLEDGTLAVASGVED